MQSDARKRLGGPLSIAEQLQVRIDHSRQWAIDHKQHLPGDKWGYDTTLDECAVELIDTQAAEITELKNENTTLRGIAATIMPCHYCGVDDIAKCPSGFPGCPLMDDRLAADNSQAVEINSFRAAFARSPYDISPCMECGEPVVCLPDGMPMCDPCGAAAQETEADG